MVLLKYGKVYKYTIKNLHGATSKIGSVVTKLTIQYTLTCIIIYLNAHRPKEAYNPVHLDLSTIIIIQAIIVIRFILHISQALVNHKVYQEMYGKTT